MGLFDNIRGQFIDVIEWLDNTNDTIVYRFERHGNEIKQGAKLTVRPGQLAVFVSEGEVADRFEPGMYELYTQNLPILTTLKSWKYGFNSPFKAEVYFFSTRIFANLKWGTSNPILIRDPELGPVRLRAYGTYSIRVSDPRQFLQEVVGTDGLFQVDEISAYLRDIIVPSASSWLAGSGIPLLDVAAQYRQLGDRVRDGIQNELKALGLELSKLLIENVSMPAEVEEALDKRASMGLLGDMQQYTQYQAANAIENSAKNPGGGNPAMELGVGVAMGQQMMNAMQGQSQPSTPPPLNQNQWYMADSGKQLGPFPLNQLQQQGLRPQTLVWRNGMSGWVQASQVPELAALFPPAVPVPPPLPTQSPASSPEQPEWYIFRSGDRVGPFTLEGLREQGISGRTNICREGETDWTRAREIPELAALLASMEGDA